MDKEFLDKFVPELHNSIEELMPGIQVLTGIIDNLRGHIQYVVKNRGSGRYEDPEGNLWIVGKDDILRYTPLAGRLRQNPKCHPREI